MVQVDKDVQDRDYRVEQESRPISCELSLVMQDKKEEKKASGVDGQSEADP
jgi:hypothetical protein